MSCEVALDSSNSSIFEPLRDHTREIRLLHLQPAESRCDLIQSSLHNVQLNKSTKYIVLGSSEERLPLDHGILCNEQLVLIMADFYSRLQDLRDFGWQWTWIEELCIDLGNANENAQQQKLVPAIYQQAIQLFIKDFHYYTLLSKNHIRLVELGSAESINALPYIHIHNVSLDHAPKFKFVVLTYDMPEESEPARRQLICNRQTLRVTWSVIQALRSLRSMGHTSFWFKPICVNH
jgi:Heterokaryon incompatibility protein (HET)